MTAVTLKQSEKYFVNLLYIRAGDTVFEIDERIVKCNSSTLKARLEPVFDSEVPVDEPREGSKSYPLDLDGVTPTELTTVLDALFPSYYVEFEMQGLMVETGPEPIDAWLTIANFAYRWGFQALHENHVYYLKKYMADPVQKLALYRKYNVLVDEYFGLAMEELVTREEDPSAEEMGEIGLDHVVKLCTLRGLYSCSPDLKSSDRLQQRIKEMWKIERWSLS